MNERLREYVTSQSFSFHLHKSHITVLHLLITNNQTARFALFVPAVDGLIRRGLVTHPGKGIDGAYTVTKAGEYAYGLLQEAGLLPEEMRVAA